MTPEPAPNSPTDSSETSATVQLLVADAGNRSAISGMLDGQFDVETSQTVTDADLYLIEDHRFPEYRAALRERIEREQPVFCPIVLIRRESTDLGPGGVDPSAPEGGVRYDEVVDAPINPPQLIRRLNSLLVRRQQSRELMQQVSTLEEREQRLRRFEQGVESTGNGIVMTDSAGTIEYVNPALESIAGYPGDEVLGESPQILLPEGTGEVFDEEFWRTMVDQAEWEGDIIIERKNSQRLVVKATATALLDAENETEGFVIVLSDITERIQREQDLEDREVELDLLRQILTRYLRHNLRNDLNVIQGNAQMLVEDETLSPKQIELAETIIENSEDLLKMSDTARTYSTLLERDAELSPFDLSEITRSAVQNIRENHPEVNFEIDVPETCDILAREGIQRAMEELIDNAARHNDATDPWVRVQIRDRDGARLVIEDNGPGIPDQELASLKSGTETQLTHSQGVGLWLSKWIIEGVDGQLSVELTDTGTRVIVDFPPIAKVGSAGLEVVTLKERERRLQTITDRMTDAIIEVDSNWNVILIDGRAERIFDIAKNAVMGQSFWDVFPYLRDTEFETVVRNEMESRSSARVEEYFSEIDAWLEVNVYPEFDGGLSLYTRDITERKEHEQELKRTNKLFERAQAVGEVGWWQIDIPSGDITWSKQVSEMWGAEGDVSSIDYETFLDFIHPEDAEYVDERWEAATNGQPYDIEHRIISGNGDVKWMREQAELTFNDDGVPVSAIGIVQDITELKEREEALKETKQRLETIIELSPEPVMALDSTGTVTLWNKAAVDVFGYTAEQAIGEQVQSLNLFKKGKFSRFEEQFERVLAGETIRGLRVEHRQKDGSSLDLRISATPLHEVSDGESGMLAVVQDITALKERERHLQERVKELSSVHATTDLFQSVDVPIEVLLSEFIETIPGAFQYPDITAARIRFDDFEVATTGFESREHVLTDRTDLDDGSTLRLDVGYLSDPRVDDSDPFLDEEVALLDTLLTVVKNHLHRRTYLNAVERTEELLTNAERLGDVGAWEVDLETNEVFWTDGARRIHGVSEGFDLTPESTIGFYHPEDRDTVNEAIETCAESGDPFSLEARIQTTEGNERWVQIEGERRETEAKTPKVRGYIQDITERKERNLRYEAIFNQTFQFTGLLEPDGTLIEANDAALEFGGIERADVVGKKVWNAHWFEITEETQRQTKADVQRAAAGEFVRRELEVQGRDGTVVIDFSIRPVTDEDGTVVYLVPEGRDISELKQREQELQREGGRFKAVFENSFDAMVLADDDGRYIEVNESATEMFGVAEDELLGRSIAEFAPPDFDFAEAWEEFQASGDERGTFPLVRPDGEERIVEFAATRNIVPGQHLSILRDVTERYLEEGKRETIINRVTDAIVEVDSDWRFTLVNEQAEVLYGMDEEYLLGRDFWTVFEAAKGTTFEEEYRGVMETREPTSFVEYFSQLDGWFDIKAYPKDDGGIAFYFIEVTEQYERERELERANEFLSTLFETIPAGVAVLDSDGNITRANSYAETELGLVESDITDRTYQDPKWEIFGADGEPIPPDELPFSQVMETGEMVVDYEHGIGLPDGSKRWLTINVAPITGADGDVEKVIAVIRDDTDLREYRQSLDAKNERLEQFTSTVSHDLRNPLAVAEGRLELAQEDCDNEHLEYVDRAHQRMETLIEDMLTLAREGKTVSDRESVDLSAVVMGSWANVETENATIVVDIDRTIRGDESRLLQLFENLFHNAVLHGGEDITVRVGECDGGFYVEDDGQGIPEEMRETIFEAGFSTSGEGTGFGLNIVKSIVEAHDWQIRVTEGVDGGARFEITGVGFGAE